VLNRMVAEGYISDAQVSEAIKTEVDIKPRRNWYIEEIPYYTEHVRRYLEKKYGADALYTQGLKVYTAVNIEMQKTARQEIQKGLYDLDKRQGYRGPLKHLEPQEIEAFSKALQAELDADPLEQGKTVNGVVVKVDDRKKTVAVRMGKAMGRIELEDMQWARQAGNPLV